MDPVKTPFVVKSLAAVLVLWALLLHGSAFISAGALWRDEASSVNQAEAGSWTALWASLRYDSFPAFFPSLLHVFLRALPAPRDSQLRLAGCLVGVALLASVWQSARLLGSRFPVVALALVAVDPVFVSEADSIRPYGIALLCLLWSFCAHGKLVSNPSLPWLLVASAGSVLAVQASYTGAIFVGVFGISAGIMILLRRSPRQLWRVLVPGVLAALSLLPYVPTLRQAGEWVSLLRNQVDWRDYLKGYISEHSVASLIAWVLLMLLGGYCLYRFFVDRRDRIASDDAVIAYSVAAAATGLVAQILFVQSMGIPPFPRYFLPGLLPAALALDLITCELRPPIRAGAALFVMLVTIGPSWNWVRLRHSNVDLVARVLSENAGGRDLVVLSPWFLHPGFQRYYRGAAPWVTVPEMPRDPMTRYDLFEEAMADPQREARLYERIRQTGAGGGAIWFVSQSFPERPAADTMPDPPPRTGPRDGSGYVRFRSYWERAIVFRLYSCCRPFEWPMPRGGPVWDEENLTLTLWRPEAGQPRK